MTTKQATLKNTYSTSKNIFPTIQRTLAQNGARGINWEYGTNDLVGRIMGLTFSMEVGGRTLHFKMPVNVQATLQALRADARTTAQFRAVTFEKAYQVAWANVRDMISVQMALVRIRAVNLEQIFLPYMLVGPDTTVYDMMEMRDFLALPEPKAGVVVDEE